MKLKVMISSTGMLLTDLYQLTMLQGYWNSSIKDVAVFEFFVRELPPGRGYLVAAGLEQVLDYFEQAHFTDTELAWAEQSGYFSPAFIDSLRDFRFTGDVNAMPEGTLFFPYEPMIQVIAPISQAQLVETRVINLLQFQSLIATKANRCVSAAPDRLLVDFGLRRAHGSEAGLLAARACYLAGFSGTSTVLAAPQFGIPIYGTMAHSFIEAHGSERQAFLDFARANPANVVLLIDTYDTERAAMTIPTIAAELKKEKIEIKAVRLDSGDLLAHASNVRHILDRAGLEQVKIFSSGGLDEYQVQSLMSAGAPIDGFGIGSRLDTSDDAPYLDCAYKLVEYAGRARRKHSEHKATWPGRKQVYRHYDEAGFMQNDTIACDDEEMEGEALLAPVMREGRKLTSNEVLNDARECLRTQFERLPPELAQLDAQQQYPVTISPGLQLLAEQTDQWIASHVETG